MADVARTAGAFLTLIHLFIRRSSETKRKVKFYSLTRAGAKQLNVEVANWERATALVARFLEAES